ncbi:RagB/SusD family nutrient uptake outer membrane protein [Pedobacter duraquae]|uniref:Putative outer membrane starch-binding protein n=1 Tax=Pedobacter duraquae TaxID=425511 RepID=A0A4R6IBK6_9SPHI|nr:RagB/SusD family nutrient uptake outer membrane protein [Pedobacter duraquae]TDO19583.1 putative outer membrane starch-binding protein [Pedobacter duraquae]
MKNSKYMLILLTGALSFGSCKKDFLELFPEGQMNEGNFYKSTVDFQQAVVGAYTPLRDVANIAFYMDEMRSDNAHYDYNSKDRGGLGYEQLADFLDNSQNGVTATRYQGDYNGISRTNVILDRLEKITFTMADADRKQIVGETKALRAHYYFDLVRHYGGVPLHLHEVTEKSQATLPRSTAEQVYAQIIADFTDALANVAAPKLPQETGRVTKGMVATELAHVYMTLKQFDKAIPLLQSVTTMGYSLWANYEDAFKNENKNNKESIFEVQYKDGTDGQSSTFIYRFIPNGNTLNITGISYNDTNGGWNYPTDDLLAAYEPNDKRLDATIGVIEGTYNANTDFVASKIVSIVNYKAPTGVIAKYFIRKYFHPPYLLANNTKENWPIYRYSNVLLMLAECLNETGQSAAALPYLNQVRTRAGLAATTTIDPALLRPIIAHERRIELAFENHRWLDLVRTDQAIPVLTAYGIKTKAQFGYILPAAYNVTAARFIYPIPFRELQLNTALVQSPGY